MPIFTIHIGPSFDGYKLVDSAATIDDQIKQQIFQHQIPGESNKKAQRMAGGRALRELGRPGWDLAVVDRHNPQVGFSCEISGTQEFLGIHIRLGVPTQSYTELAAFRPDSLAGHRIPGLVN